MNFWLAFLYSFISTAGFSLVGIYLGKVTQKIGAFWTTFWMQVVGLIMTLLLAPFFGIQLSATIFLLYLAVFGVGAVFLLILYSKALSIGPPAVVQAIGRIGNVITVLLAVLLLGETFSAGKIIGSFILLCGVILVSLDMEQLMKKHVSLLTKAVPIALLQSVVGGVLFFILGIATKQFDGFSASIGTRLFCVPVYLLLAIPQTKPTGPALRSVWKPLLFIAGADVVAYIMFNTSVQIYQVSFAAMMQSLSPVMTALFSWLLFREHLHRSQIIGVVLATVGTIFVAVG